MTEPLPLFPRPGFYKIRLAKRAAWSPVRIWFGLPISQDSPRLLDRSPRYQCLVNGRIARDDWQQMTIWPFCARWPITKNEYRYLLQLHRWAVAHAPEEPAANPRRAIDFSRVLPAF